MKKLYILLFLSLSICSAQPAMSAQPDWTIYTTHKYEDHLEVRIVTQEAVELFCIAMTEDRVPLVWKPIKAKKPISRHLFSTGDIDMVGVFECNETRWKIL